MSAIVARVPVPITIFSPRTTRVPPSLRDTSSVLGPVNFAEPIINSAPLALKLAT